MPVSRARQLPLISRSSHAGRCLAASAALLLLAGSALQNAAADGETRTLTIHHTHTGEDITVTFKRNGRLDDAALARLNHFLRDWRNDEKTNMDPTLFDIVWEVYQEVGAREPIQIISAYRSPVTNAMLRRRSRGVAQFSQHMLGKAMDFNIPGVALEQVRAAGLRLQRGGVGFYPTSGSPFVHLDVGSVRHWPRMTHDQLARVFPNGRTVHVPSDGRPLSGYELALADVQRRGGAPSAVSLASARDAGVTGANAAGAEKPKKSLLASLFGFGREASDDEDANEAPSRGRKLAVTTRGKSAEEAEPARPVVTAAAAVPLPRMRPLAREPKPELGAFNLASANVTPAEIVRMRGLWTARDVAAAENPAPLASRNERLVWQTGPHGRAGAANAHGVRARVELASASAETTASVPWPEGLREDRIPSELVLAYAAQSTPPQPAARPMGTVRGNQSVVARSPAPARSAAMAAPQRLVENPWLRGILLSPSITDAMGTGLAGTTSARALASFMHKPGSALALGFSGDTAVTEAGVQTFRGRAVAFLPSVAFGTRTAGLN